MDRGMHRSTAVLSCPFLAMQAAAEAKIEIEVKGASHRMPCTLEVLSSSRLTKLAGLLDICYVLQLEAERCSRDGISDMLGLRAIRSPDRARCDRWFESNNLATTWLTHKVL